MRFLPHARGPGRGGETAQGVSTGAKLRERHWYFVAASHDGASVTLHQEPVAKHDFQPERGVSVTRPLAAPSGGGPLFFAAAQRFLLRLTETADVRVVILRMSRVTTLDATGAHVLGEAIEHLERRGITVLLSGIKPGHDGVIAALGVADHLRSDGRVFPDTPTAITEARQLVQTLARA